MLYVPSKGTEITADTHLKMQQPSRDEGKTIETGRGQDASRQLG